MSDEWQDIDEGDWLDENFDGLVDDWSDLVEIGEQAGDVDIDSFVDDFSDYAVEVMDQFFG